MHEYRFEIKATQVITIAAPDEAAARKVLLRCGDAETHLQNVPLATNDYETGVIDDHLEWEDGEPFLVEVDSTDVEEQP